MEHSQLERFEQCEKHNIRNVGDSEHDELDEAPYDRFAGLSIGEIVDPRMYHSTSTYAMGGEFRYTFE